MLPAKSPPRTILEAILFVGHPTGEPLTSERIAGLMRGVRPAEIDDLVQELNAQYDASRTPLFDHFRRARISARAPGRVCHPCETRFTPAFREARLSPAAIDVLASVAYHQPLAAEEIDRLRGRPSGANLITAHSTGSAPDRTAWPTEKPSLSTIRQHDFLNFSASKRSGSFQEPKIIDPE